MALAVVQIGGKFTASASASVTSATLTTTAGNLLICTVSVWDNGTLLADHSTVADNKSNSWAVNVTAKGTGTANAEKNEVIVASAQCTTGGASHTVTVTDPRGGGEF